MEKNAWAVAEEVVRRVDDAPAPRGYMSAMMVDKPEEMIFYNRDFMKQYHDAPNNKKNTVPGHGYLLNQLHLKRSTARKGNCTWSTEKCLVKRKTASYANTVEQLIF